jgi:apolipoprotein N-acyltransferase
MVYSARSWLKVLALSLGSSVLLWLSYYPAACGWLGWVALVPLLCLVRIQASSRVIYLSAWLGILVFFAAVIQWMRVADWRMYFTWLGLTFYCSWFVLLGLYLIRSLDRRTRLPLVVTVPAVWTALEFARAHLLTGFPWYYLAHTQHQYLVLIQISDLGGAYGVSFLVAALNAFVFELLQLLPALRLGLGVVPKLSSHRALAFQGVGIALLLAATIAYGEWRMSQNSFEPGPKLALLQGNLDQRIRNQASSKDDAKIAVAEIVKHYEHLSDQAILSRPEMIVWPETSYPSGWYEVSPDLPRDRAPPEWILISGDSAAVARNIGRRWRTNVLLGTNGYVLRADERPESFNSAILIRPDGQVAGRYDKIHRVPFGEFVPFRDWLPWMNKFAPYDFDYSISSGRQQTRFSLERYHFGVLICYEDTDPYLARQYVRDGPEPKVDFLVNISNDGWFDGTSEHEEHLAICRFRAVECRRAVARAVNMGISAIIDGNGLVVALPGADLAHSKKVAAVLTGAVPIDRRQSLYAQWGDWLPWSCGILIMAGLLLGYLRPPLS